MGKIGDAPCMNCEERYFGCHGKCDRYKTFREERNRMLAESVKVKEAYYYNKNKVFCKSKRERICNGR